MSGRPGPYRLSQGGELDRAQPVPFYFDGKPYRGLGGDTLASALLANGERSIGRSYKLHRPRGLYSCGPEEPNGLVQLGSGAQMVPSARSTLIELRSGLEAHSYAGWPSRRFDLARVLDFSAPLWAAGFYNKTFRWPSWHTYENAVRGMASGAQAPHEPDPDRYEARNLHCDVLIIGAGEAGLRAADAAAAEGSCVVLVEQDVRLGGRCAWDGSMADGMRGSLWVQLTQERLARANVGILTRTTATGCYDHGVVALSETIAPERVRDGTPRERYWTVRTKRLVLATGAIEQPLIFCNNDRPGIMLAEAARQYLRRYGVAIGRRVVVATNNDSAYAVARELKEAGVEVLALADTRRETPAALVDELRAVSVPVLARSIPVDTSGFGALASVSIGRLSADLTRVESVSRYACDSLAVSGGWNPTLHLYSQAGGKLAYSETSQVLEPLTRHPSVTLTGAAASESSAQPIGIRVSPVGSSSRKWVDLRHDVTVADLELALRENYSAIEHVKRYTTAGMSADQGKTSNIPALEIVANLRGVKAAELGHTTFRPPFMPVTLGAIAGRSIGSRFAPSRQLPVHEWHVKNGAVLEDFGEWKRPALYLRDGESRHSAIRREARTARTAVGLCDSSPLGKIEVHGPDAQEFLDRFYINNLKTLKPGLARYGIMLTESGIVFDDGTVVMLGPDHFVITTTSAHAARVARWLEEWRQCEWPQMRVATTVVSEQWATLSLAGPKSRDVLARLDSDINLSGAAFPHLAMRESRLLGVPARIYRVSFTGELTYEINVPTRWAQDLWNALVEAGEPEGLQPFGLEALLLMRMEKGFLHIGTDTDGTTVPDDVGWGSVAAKKVADFIGKRSLTLPEHVRADRLQLVGLIGDTDILPGSHLRLPDSVSATDGWVTSAGRMVISGKPVGMAMLRGGRGRMGTQVTVHDQGRLTRAKVVELPFLDPAGARMNA